MEWSRAVRNGKVTEALRLVNPRKRAGPWTILCAGEGFLRARESLAAYRSKNITLWDVPAKSPDLNPVEMFWAWLRKKLRLMDLAGLQKKRRPFGKAAYILRVKRVISTQKAQSVAKNCARRFRTSCPQVVGRQGIAVGS